MGLIEIKLCKLVRFPPLITDIIIDNEFTSECVNVWAVEAAGVQLLHSRQMHGQTKMKLACPCLTCH